MDVLRGQIAFAQGRGSDAPPLLLKAAKRLEPLDAGLAREAYLEASGAVLFAGRLSGAIGVGEVARAASRAGSSSQPPQGLDLLLDGLVTRFTEGYPAGMAPLRRALRALQALLREHGLVPFALGVSPSCGTTGPGMSSPVSGSGPLGTPVPSRPSQWAHLPRRPAHIRRRIPRRSGNARGGSPLLLTAGAHGDRVELRVIDREPDIPKAERDRAFMPFHQLGGTGSTTGVGLELTVSRGRNSTRRPLAAAPSPS